MVLNRTCWFCREEVVTEDIHSHESNPEFAAFGYCYCKSCMSEFKEGLSRLEEEVQGLEAMGLDRGEAVKLQCFGAE